MAGRSLGTLTLDLVAKIGAFTGPLDKASREAKKRNAEIAKSFDSLAKGIGVAIGSIPAVLTALVVHSASVAKEISNQAALAGLGTTEFQKFAAGAKTVGVEQDKLADIFKDTNDKLGDFMNTGGGALKDFFDNIAPKVGVTADQFKKLNSKDALALYVTSLEKANVNQQEMTFYMEAIANDSTALVPLLRNSGKAFDELGESAYAAGVVMDETTIAAAKQFGIELDGLGQYITSAKTMLAAEFLPVLAQFSKDVNQSAKDAGGLKGTVGDLGESLVTAAAFIANTGDAITRVFKIVSNTLVGTFSTATGYMQKLDAAGQAGLSQLSFGDTSKKFAANAAKMAADAKVSFGVAEQAAAAIKNELETPLAGDSFKQYVSDAKKAAAEIAAQNPIITPGTGSGVDPAAIKAAAEAAKKASSDAAAAAKRISDAFKGSETDLMRQIALINTSVDAQKKATEVDKLRFEIASGKLVGINKDQQKRLESLAAELDVLEKLKIANEEEAKSAAYAANLKAANSTIKAGFDSDIAGAGLGDKARDRLRQDLAIRQDYNQQVAELQKQLNFGDISQELYGTETGMLKDALDERLDLQQDYYDQLDEAQSNWLDGVSSAWENYRDTATDYQQQAANATYDILDGLTNSISDNLSAMILEGQSLGDTFRNVATTMATSIINALTQMAAQWLVYQGVQLLTGQTTQAASVAAAAVSGPAIAAAYAPAASLVSLASFGANSVPATAGILSTTAVAEGVALAGMAHDGIDSVPETGTWLLQRGERVTTAETSAKLDQTLERVQSNSNRNDLASSGPTSIHINLPNATDARSGREAGAAAARKLTRAVKAANRYS